MPDNTNPANPIASDDGAKGSTDHRLRRPSDAFQTAEMSVRVGRVTTLIKARRSRSRFFRDELFADPAWDILLDLTRAELEGRRISVSSLCTAAAVPPTTALRWINLLTVEDMLVRRLDPLDRRRVFVELSLSASKSMRQYLVEFDGGPYPPSESSRVKQRDEPSPGIGQPHHL